MSSAESILDKVLENKQAEDLYQFDPLVILQDLFAHLSERERDVLSRRFGLEGSEPQTLEKIGQLFGVTRERVRQIETGSIKKLKKVDETNGHLKHVESVLHQVLHNHGGIMEEQHMIDRLLGHQGNQDKHRSVMIFFVDRLLSDKFDSFGHPVQYHRSWKLVTHEESRIEDFVKRLVAFVEAQQKPVAEDDLVAAFIEAHGEEHPDQAVRSHLRIAKVLKQNIFGHWGKADWNTITPKRMNDKIYLVLKEGTKPLHFTEIAEKINALKFDHKVAYPATVHNELILDDKYVLVGRGIYALAEWGYERGVVADVIARVLAKQSRPMTRDEIVEEVLKQRLVGKSTIHLALMNKSRFQKDENGKYTVFVQSSPQETAAN